MSRKARDAEIARRRDADGKADDIGAVKQETAGKADAVNGRTAGASIASGAVGVGVVVAAERSAGGVLCQRALAGVAIILAGW